VIRQAHNWKTLCKAGILGIQEQEEIIMKNAGILFIISILLLFTAATYGQEPKGETVSGGTGTARETMKTPPAGQPEGMKETMHDHGMGAVKQFVAATGPDGVQHVEITGGEYYFDPNYIIVKANVPVEFRVRKAKGYVPHDIVVNAPDAGITFRVDLKDDWQSIKFTPTKTGKYVIDCDQKLLWFKSHKERGMHGTIEVVP
jgi:plastocyanin